MGAGFYKDVHRGGDGYDAALEILGEVREMDLHSKILPEASQERPRKKFGGRLAIRGLRIEQGKIRTHRKSI